MKYCNRIILLVLVVLLSFALFQPYHIAEKRHGNLFLQQDVKKIIKIEDTCYQSLPCKHYVRYEDINDKLQRRMFNSDQIYQICKQVGHPVERHFIPRN
jgi:hypothetical protein